MEPDLSLQAERFIGAEFFNEVVECFQILSCPTRRVEAMEEHLSSDRAHRAVDETEDGFQIEIFPRPPVEDVHAVFSGTHPFMVSRDRRQVLFSDAWMTPLGP